MGASCVLAFLCLLASAPSLEESLALRRVAAFWEEGEYLLAKKEIESYLTLYPESERADQLRAGLGDLYFREKLYRDALNVYGQIQDPNIQSAVLFSKLRCFFELQWFASLADTCESLLKETREEVVIDYFIEALEELALSNPSQKEKCLERARPFASNLSSSSTIGYAHLLSLNQKHEEARALYLSLRELEGVSPEEMQFQAALEESHYAPQDAIASFAEIEAMKGLREEAAREERLSLLLTLKRFEEIVQERDRLRSSKRSLLFLAKAERGLGHNEEATRLLAESLNGIESDETGRFILLHLAEAAAQSGDLESLERAERELCERFPLEEELANVGLAKVHLLREKKRFDEALAAWDSLFLKTPEALLERVALDFDMERWNECVGRTESLLESSPEAWRYRLAALSHLGSREGLVANLQTLQRYAHLFTEDENANWALLHAKTLYDLGEKEEALHLLEPLSQPNAFVLKALCSPEHAIEFLEQALALKADLVPVGELHLLVYNSALEQGNLDKAAEHLFAAGEILSIERENLLWLARHFRSRDVEKSRLVYEKYFSEPSLEEAAIERADLFESQEEKFAWLSLLRPLGNDGDLLHDEVEVRLADLALGRGDREEARTLYQNILRRHPPLESAPSARASLALAHLLIEEGKITEALPLLKGTALQMNFAHEPYHLQAAIEYAELQGDLAPPQEKWAKRLALLEKTLEQFTQPVDLLAKDYQNSRPYFPEKEPIYAAYIARIEAEIAECKRTLQESYDEASQASSR